jgi:thiol-disulfide isomerase/thioredoxin
VKGLLLFFLTCSLCVAESAGSLSPARLQEYRGKIVVLNFWAAWCKPCKKEMPVLLELQRQFEARGVQFVGACTDEAKDQEKAEAFLRTNAVSYPVWFGFSDKEMKSLGLGSAIPATAIFDREGKRVFRLIGEVKKKHLVERLEWLLGNQKGRSPRELLLPSLIDSSEYKGQ